MSYDLENHMVAYDEEDYRALFECEDTSLVDDEAAMDQLKEHINHANNTK